MMLPAGALQRLIAIAAELSSFRTAQCAMVHEEVRAVTRGDFARHPDNPGWSIDLRGFCDKRLRDARLGCAHTAANDRYQALLHEAVRIGEPVALALPVDEIASVILEIYLIDHEKGRLEKRAAVVAQETPDALELREIRDRLADVKQRHFALTDELTAHHQQVLAILRTVAMPWPQPID